MLTRVKPMMVGDTSNRCARYVALSMNQPLPLTRAHRPRTKTMMLIHRWLVERIMEYWIRRDGINQPCRDGPVIREP